MKITKRIEKMIENNKFARRRKMAEKLALPATSRKIAKLKAIEAAVRKYYKVNTKVYYISEEYREKFDKDEDTYGFYNNEGYAVIFIGKTCNYVKQVETLCHEMTHAYQHKYNRKKFIDSCIALDRGQVSYEEAWHEADARQQAAEMCEYFLYSYSVAI